MNNINADLQNRQKFISYQWQISSHLVEDLTIRRILDYKTRQLPQSSLSEKRKGEIVESVAPATPKHCPQRSWRQGILIQHKHKRNHAKTHKRESNHNPEPTTSIRIASASWYQQPWGNRR
jgi:hypothetical protein